ncbi:toll-like receptor 2 [Protobothrops mucrosquamatus]|uniref:toll-like receptor 2 n=1 Tax=Protobothrops mucrosquamatus TaxID=103944 RepID=UPI000775B552|nr:toll-like receptor 2 [Protobothrops mucrosquamatus]
MGFFIKTLHFYLIILFCSGDEQFQHSDNKSLLSKSSPSSFPESQIPRRGLSFLHNVRTKTAKKKAGLNILNILNMRHNYSFQVDPTIVLSNIQPQHRSSHKFSQTDGIINDSLTDPSLRSMTLSPKPAEKQQEAESLLNLNSVLKWNVLGDEQYNKKETRFSSSTLQISASCGIPANGTFDLSNRKLTENELRGKMDPIFCKATLDQIKKFNASLNNLETDIATLIPLFLEMKSVYLIDVSYNKIFINTKSAKDSYNLQHNNLLFLNLSHNPLKTLKNLILPRGLKSIDLSFTQINQIPKEFIAILSQIEEVFLQGNPFIYNAEALMSNFNPVLTIRNQKHFFNGGISYTNFPQSTIHQIMLHCFTEELPEGFQNTKNPHIFLDLSNKSIHNFHYLPKSLRHFDLSNCNLQGKASPNLFPNLTVFKIQNNKIKKISPYLPDSLEECDLSKNNIRNFPFHGAEQSLKLLNLSRNLLKQLNVNTSYLSLNNLDVSHNLITNLLGHMGTFLPELKYLNLSENKIFFLQPGSLPKSLVELDISNNAIAILMKDMFLHLTNLKILTLQGEHFFCNCELYWFANTYLANPQMQINGQERLFCGFPKKKRGLMLQNSHLTMLYCSLGLQIGITVVTVILFMSVISVLCWHFDVPWYLKMGWYWCKAKRKQYEKRPEHKIYDAFISYSENDASWTKETLLKNLEASGFKVCYHERDFMPGHPVLGNIFYCIENSHKVLFVLSPSFVHSCWCQYELYFAEHRVLTENQDSLIMVVLEDLPANSIPKKFSKLRKLLQRKTYLKWSPEEHKQKLFWHQLSTVLKTMNEPVLRTQRKSCIRKQTDSTE